MIAAASKCGYQGRITPGRHVAGLSAPWTSRSANRRPLAKRDFSYLIARRPATIDG